MLIYNKGEITMDERITFIVDGQGNYEVETHNFKGKTCETVVNQILVGVGGNMVESNKKASYYEDGDNPVEILQR